ncbi:DUF3231 family protein [Alteribacillus sp. HJP-4]|uniref:DUF3231 family protein n=1 Tax=Alteribacillus sp. HJP-4 TaxID=2775394 RepID=UPI0035CCE55C
MGILGGNQREEPLHYGEIFGMWTYLNGLKGMIAGYQTFVNHSGDQDLVTYLEQAINQAFQEEQQIEEVLKMNGIGLPPSPPERPVASIESIPAGARFNDPEISATLSRDVAQGLVACSQIMGQCTREDIATMFGQFHAAKAQAGSQLLRMNKEKGWLIPPPLHMDTRETELV